MWTPPDFWQRKESNFFRSGGSIQVRRNKEKVREKREKDKKKPRQIVFYLSFLSSSFFVSVSKKEVKKKVYSLSIYPSSFSSHFPVVIFSFHRFILSFLSLYLALLQSNNEEREICIFLIPSLFTLFSHFLCPLTFLAYSIFIFLYVSKVIKEREQRPFFSFFLYCFPVVT